MNARASRSSAESTERSASRSCGGTRPASEGAASLSPPPRLASRSRQRSPPGDRASAGIVSLLGARPSSARVAVDVAVELAPSPRARRPSLIGSARSILRRSISKPRAARSSAIWAAVTEPKSLPSSPAFALHLELPSPSMRLAASSSGRRAPSRPSPRSGASGARPRGSCPRSPAWPCPRGTRKFFAKPGLTRRRRRRRGRARHVFLAGSASRSPWLASQTWEGA